MEYPEKVNALAKDAIEGATGVYSAVQQAWQMGRQCNEKNHGEYLDFKILTKCDICGEYHNRTCVYCIAASHKNGKYSYCEGCQRAAESDE